MLGAQDSFFNAVGVTGHTVDSPSFFLGRDILHLRTAGSNATAIGQNIIVERDCMVIGSASGQQGGGGGERNLIIAKGNCGRTSTGDFGVQVGGQMGDTWGNEAILFGKIGVLASLGTGNTLIGNRIGWFQSMGDNNTALGQKIEDNDTAGNNNIMIGRNITSNSNDGTILIGSNITSTTDDELIVKLGSGNTLQTELNIDSIAATGAIEYLTLNINGQAYKLTLQQI